jgi:hypothetical protein
MVPVRRVLVTAEKASRVLVATDGKGLLVSKDGGLLFDRVFGSRCSIRRRRFLGLRLTRCPLR